MHMFLVKRAVAVWTPTRQPPRSPRIRLAEPASLTVARARARLAPRRSKLAEWVKLRGGGK
ncbi:MAG TPA: hypothetical protein VKY73_22230 [Polyangiaceae bacterium]|nr:hypothetical protein [Polyangiaceae bacterium]